MKTARSLVGVWKLRSYWTRYDNEARFFPLGEDACGYIVYTHDGFMSGTMQRADVKPFSTPDRLKASEQEKAQAFDAYVTYCGRYRVEGDTAFHKVEMSLLPNWIGQEQERRIEWEDDHRVRLVAQWNLQGTTRTAVVEWERAT